VLSVVLLAIGCIKSQDSETACTLKPIAEEMTAMTKFATDSAITTTQDASGILYQIIEPGTGATPTAGSSVTARYVGRFLSGKGFDSTTTKYPDGIAFPLNGVIKGWQLGIPKIKEGGKIKLIIPSSLAYGCQNYFSIPANSPLYFYVELVKVQ